VTAAVSLLGRGISSSSARARARLSRRPSCRATRATAAADSSPRPRRAITPRGGAAVGRPPEPGGTSSPPPDDVRLRSNRTATAAWRRSCP